MKRIRGLVRYQIVNLAVVVAICLGCDSKSGTATPNEFKGKSLKLGNSDFVGVWQCPADDGKWITTEWGPMRFKLTLGQDGTIEFASTIDPNSPPGGGTVKSNGKYNLTADSLVSEEIWGEESVKVSLKNNRLYLWATGEEAPLVFRKVK